MAFKNYNRQLVLRLVGLVLVSLLTGWMIARSQSPWLIGFLGVVVVLLLISLTYFLNSINRQIHFFIQAVKNDDTTLRFPLKTGNAIINDLHQSLNELNVILQQTKMKSQIRERYFSEILQNIGTGIIVLNEKGFVTIVNTAALELLGMQTFTHLTQLDRIDPRFKSSILALGTQQKQVITLHKGNEQVQIITRCSSISLKDEQVKLITLQDIRGELERKELDSWVKLIRVLSHEIMNSLAPVTSIAQSLKSIWKKKTNESEALTPEDIESTINGLDVIGERGEGLIHFVNSYRMLTKVPVPQFSMVRITSLFERLSILVSPLKSEFGVGIRFYPPREDFETRIDEQMMVQVVINLVKNGVEAAQNVLDPMVEVLGEKLNSGETEIKVIDNGCGIPDEISDEIFVPFFTTKSSGSGIGLSHSRQIMRAHGGTIGCHSSNGTTVFRLVW